MGSNIRIKDSIVQGESEGKSFYEIVEAAYTFGWRTFDQACMDAYEQGAITEETALLYCSKRGPTTRGIDNIKKRRGEQTSSLSNLKMKTEEEEKARAKEEAAKKGPAPAIPGALKLKL